MPPSEAQDWQAYREAGDPDAHQRLCERYLPQVRRLVGRMSIYLPDGALDREDLIQAGVIGLIHSVEQYDPSKGVPFFDFAVKRIRGAVFDELRALDGYSSRARRQKQHLEKIRETLQHRLLRPPSEEETAQELGISLEQLHDLQTSLPTLRVEPLEPGQEELLGHRQGPERMQNWMPDADGLSWAEKFRIVAAQIEKLPQRSQVVLGLYYRDGLTLKEIAQVLDLTESRICQIHAAALELLQQQLGGIEMAFAGRGAPHGGAD